MTTSPTTAAPAARPAGVDIVREFPDTGWRDDGGPTRAVEPLIEHGQVLSFPRLAFAMSDAERRFLDPRWTDGRAKNISLRWPGEAGAELRGASAEGADRQALQAFVARYADSAQALAERLFPHYRGRLRRGNTSFRAIDVGSRRTSWRKDDTRLHVDAFPSNPTQGTRLLRVFCNVHPGDVPRRWRVGEDFETHARRYLKTIPAPLPGSAWLLRALSVTKRRRTPYDHYMLQLHDRAKADAAFQRDSPQAAVDLAPGTTWVVFSDQVLHAVMGGQFMLEQTFLLDVEDQFDPALSPLRTLERLLGRPLR